MITYSTGTDDLFTSLWKMYFSKQMMITNESTIVAHFVHDEDEALVPVSHGFHRIPIEIRAKLTAIQQITY